MSETYDAATEALSAGLPPNAENQAGEASPTPEPVVPTEENVPASKEVDISHLPEEAQIYIRARERELLGDATRKWQEAAETRREAEQSIAFVQALNTDPDFARQVHEFLNSNLSAAGYLSSGETETSWEEDDYFDDSGSDPYQAEIAELKEWKANLEEQMMVERLSAELDHQIARVRHDNPEWDDNDMQAIIDLGFATQGNLLRAAEEYRAIQDRNLQRYLERKGSVTAPPMVQGSSGVAAPESFKSATDEELRQAALERIRNELG